MVIFTFEDKTFWPTGARTPEAGRGWIRKPDQVVHGITFEIWTWNDLVRVSSTLAQSNGSDGWCFHISISVREGEDRWLSPPFSICETVLDAFGLAGALEDKGRTANRRCFWRPVYNRNPTDG
jgi:hypothetical protein